MCKSMIDIFVRRIRSGVFSMLVANFFNKAASMIGSMMVTRILTTRDYGVWSYSLNIYSYLTLISGLGLATGAMQFGAENHGDGKANSFFRYCIIAGSLVNLLFITGCGIFVINMILPIPRAKPYILSILPMLLIEYILVVAQAMLRSKNFIHMYARYLNVNTILLTTGNCIGAFLGLEGMIAGRYIADAVSFAILVYILKSECRKVVNASPLNRYEKKELWKYSLYTGASSAMNLLIYSLDVTLIASLIKDENEIAFYKIGTLIPNTLYFIPNSVLVAILPTLIYNRKNIQWIKAEVKKIIISLGICNIVLCSILIGFAPLVITIVSGGKYLQSVPVFRILTLGYFFSGTFRTACVNFLASLRRVKFGLLISITSCILDIILNYCLITKIGPLGAAYSTLLIDIVTAVMSFSYLIYLIKHETVSALCTE